MKKLLMMLTVASLLSVGSNATPPAPTIVTGNQNFQWTGATTGNLSLFTGFGTSTITIDNNLNIVFFTLNGKAYSGHFTNVNVQAVGEHSLFTFGLEDMNEMEAR